MFEVLLTKKSKKIENEAKKAGFDRVFFIDSPDFALINTDKGEELRRQISSNTAKKKKIIILGSTDEINRIAVEDKRVSMLLMPEARRSKDFIRYRNSGLNHVLCRSANRNKVAIGISLESVKSTKGIERAEKMGKIMQNIALCRKYNTKIVLASFNEEPSTQNILRNFGLSIGMSTKQAKDSLENAKDFFG